MTAAPPPALRNGSAFPRDVLPQERPPHRLQGSAFQPVRRKTKVSASAGKPEAFRKAVRQSRVLHWRELLIRTALLREPRLRPAEAFAGSPLF